MGLSWPKVALWFAIALILVMVIFEPAKAVGATYAVFGWFWGGLQAFIGIFAGNGSN